MMTREESKEWLAKFWPRVRFRLFDRPTLELRTRYARYRVRRRLGSVEPGVTVVSVNFNANECARTLVHAVRRFSPSEVPIIIVDNGSADGPPEGLGPGVEVIALRRNHGHGRALDLGVLKVRTSHFVALDIDAFPIRADWLDVLMDPLAGDATVSGGHVDPEMTFYKRDYVHPCCLAMTLNAFVTGQHTFRSGVVNGLGCDAGQQISEREKPHLHLIEPTSVRGPGPIGTVFGDVVYHNFYGTRFSTGSTVLNKIIRPEDPEAAWSEAVRQYLGEH